MKTMKFAAHCHKRQAAYRRRSVGRALLVVFAALGWGAAEAGSATYSYDALGRLTQASYGSGAKVAYVYDAAGNRQTETVSGVVAAAQAKTPATVKTGTAQTAVKAAPTVTSSPQSRSGTPTQH